MLLPSKRINIDLSNVANVSEVMQHEQPGIACAYWYEFNVQLKDGKSFTLDYNTAPEAEKDKKAIIEGMKS